MGLVPRRRDLDRFRARRLLVSAFIVTAVVLGPAAGVAGIGSSAVRADSPGNTDAEEEDVVVEARTEARRLFEKADEALDAGRFAEARDLLRESLLHFRHPAAAFNLAVALRGTGDPMAAIGTFRELEAEAFGPLSGEQRMQVQRLLAEVLQEIAILSVRACGAGETIIRLDGVQVATVANCEPVELRVNPARHVVTASAEHAEAVDHAFTVARGGRQEVSLELVMRMRQNDSPALIQSPWLWAAAAGVLAAGVIAVVALAPGTQDRVTDPVFGETHTLLAR